MADEWDPAAAGRKMRARTDAPGCDALLDLDEVAGAGNLIKSGRCASWPTPPWRDTAGAGT